MKQRSFWAVAVALAMAACLMAGCTGGGQATPAPTAAPAAATAAPAATATPAPTAAPAAEAPAGGDMTVLTVYTTNSGFDLSTWGDDVLSKTVNEKLNIDLQFEVAAADDNQKLNLLIASNDLPDMVMSNRRSAPTISMIEGGLLHSLTELMDQYLPEAKNIIFFSDTANRTALEYKDTGLIYGVPHGFVDRTRMNDGVYILQRHSMYYRKDMYEAMGEPTMKSLDDLKEVLKMAVEMYPNLTHPLFLWSAGNATAGSTGPRNIYQSFGGKGQYIETDDGLKSMVRDPLYLQALLYINDLYQEGLINPSDFTDTGQIQETTNISGGYFISAGPNWRAIVAHDLTKEVDPNAYMVGLQDPLVQPGVKYFAPFDQLDGWDAVYITKNCRFPEQATQFVCYMLSEEGQELQTGGVEGIHFDWVGPESKWLMPINEAAEKMREGFGVWANFLGTYKYNFGAWNWYDSSLVWGLSYDDDWKRALYTSYTGGDDYSAFADINPDPTSDAGAAQSRFNEVWNNYHSRIALADSPSEANNLYDEFIREAELMGLKDLEAAWTENYNIKHGLN